MKKGASNMEKVCFKILSICVVLIMIIGCFSGCSKKDNNSNISDAASTDAVNSTVKDENNSSTNDSEDKDVSGTGITSSDKGQSNGSNKTTSTQNKDNANNNSSKNDASKNKNSSTDGQNKQEGNMGSASSTTTTSSKTPTTTQKISINKQRLYNHMMSVYPKPQISLTTKISKSEFTRKTNGSIPSKYQAVFDWMFAIVDGNGSEEMPALSVDETRELYNIMNEVLSYRVPISRTQNANQNWVLYINRNELKTVINKAYDNYSSTVDYQNEIAQTEYNKNLEVYEKDIKYVSEMCDLVESIGKKIGLNKQTQSEAVDLIVKYICDNCDYNFSYVGNPGDLGRTLGSCLKDKSAICVGYTKGFYALCYYAGIDVSYYEGTIPDGKHAWNSVTIDGKKYFFDVTNQDGVLKIDKNATDFIWCTANDFKTYIQKGNIIYYW